MDRNYPERAAEKAQMYLAHIEEILWVQNAKQEHSGVIAGQADAEAIAEQADSEAIARQVQAAVFAERDQLIGELLEVYAEFKDAYPNQSGVQASFWDFITELQNTPGDYVRSLADLKGRSPELFVGATIQKGVKHR